jgi:hypothetical protein
MPFEGYGGYVWSKEGPPPERDWRAQGVSLGIAAGLGAGAFHMATRLRPDGSKPVDDVARIARTTGNLLPFQLGNTFRVPELLSPLTSTKYQNMAMVVGAGGGPGLDPSGAQLWSTSWGKEYLQKGATYKYLKTLTGKSADDLAAIGITPKMRGADVAEELVFERTAKSSTGRLYTRLKDGRKLLASDNIMLQQFSGESPDLLNILDKHGKVNRAAYSTMQAMDMWGAGGFQNIDEAEDVFRISGSRPATGPAARKRPKFFPVPGVDASYRGTTLLRAMPAQSMERFNRLIGGVSEQMFGTSATDFMKRIGGFTPGVTPGPASHMYLRFGGKVGTVLGTGLAIGELDWARRQFETPGQIVASGLVSTGVGLLAKKAKFSGRASLFAGLASFAGQMILPGFDQGILPGLASTYARSSQLRATAINPFNYYRRTVEGFFPGLSDWKTGALMGVTVLGASYAKMPGTGKAIPQFLLDRFGHRAFGMKPQTSAGLSVMQPKTVRDNFWDLMIERGQDSLGDRSNFKAIKKSWESRGHYSHMGMRGGLLREYKASMGTSDLSSHMNTLWAEAEDRYRNQQIQNPMNRALEETLDDITTKYQGKGGFLDRIGMQVEGLAAQAKHSFFGAQVTEAGAREAITNMGFKSPLGRVGILFGGTLLAQQVLTGGLLGSMETAGELEDIYSGKQLVEVGRSRWWEAGGTPFEGSKTSYHRPHWYALMMNRVREKGIWGDDEDRNSPITKFFKRNFTYELERETYYDRPYPLTSTAFSDIPILGPILSTAIGQYIKPAKIMHANEWIRGVEGQGGVEYASVFEGSRREPAYDLGAVGPGIPSSPFSVVNQLSYMNYQFRELEGMTGWAKNVLSDIVVGTDTYFTGPQMAEAGAMTSHRLRFWENAMGGGFFMNEAVRRIFPNYRKEIERQNPIMNSMPTWMPDKFRYGDPYRSVEWGEARLPGAGYEALHPELQGIDPQDYPLMNQYDILANIAPFSSEFRRTRDRVYSLRAQGAYSAEQEQWMDRVDKRAAELWNVYDFQRTAPNAIQLPGSNLTQSAYYYAQKTLRKTTAPMEYLIPMGFRPVQKLLGDRDPIERYEFERLYGTPMAFWDQPWRDWFRPAMYSAMNVMGFEGKPAWRREADTTNQYFDQLEFQKWMNLAEQAGAAGDRRAQIQYEYQAGNTRMGVNPNGNPMSIYWTLPAEERAFFNSFAQAQGRDRQRILEMVPADQSHLYQTIWRRLDEGDPSLWAGGPTGPDREHMLKQFYGMQMQPKPPDDWIGWQEDVDMSDIRVRYVSEMGRDLHDFGLWENQLKQSMAQPFLDDSTQYLHSEGGPYGRGMIGSQIHGMFGAGGESTNVFMGPGPSYVDLDYNDMRDEDVYAAVQGYIGG